jgi:hypothetical protein
LAVACSCERAAAGSRATGTPRAGVLIKARSAGRSRNQGSGTAKRALRDAARQVDWRKFQRSADAAAPSGDLAKSPHLRQAPATPVRPQERHDDMPRIEGKQSVMLVSSVPDRLVYHREPVQNPTLSRDPRPVTSRGRFGQRSPGSSIRSLRINDI